MTVADQARRVSALTEVLVAAGFVFVIVAFTQYYEDVFCGELQLCKRSVHCVCPCLCPRVSCIPASAPG